MAEVKKFKSGISSRIGHNKRDIPEGKSYQNKDIRPELSKNNISLINRGSKIDTERYRKSLEKAVFKYNRKDLVHACEFCIQLPADCPPEQELDFFKESLNFLKEEYLPAGEQCILSADIHKDEWKMAEDGTRISKDHMHVMFVPIVPDTKHENFDFKLCADQLTKRAVFNTLHQNLQKYLDKKGIQATVVNKKSGDGRNIGLSVKQLKEITNKTGIVIDKSITVDRLAEILAENRDIKITDRKLRQALDSYKKQVEELQEKVSSLEKENEQQRNRIQELEKAAEVTRETTKQSTWGTSSGWGAQNKEREESRLW